MRILGDDWQDGFLDEAMRPGHCRVQVSTWHTVAPLTDLYFVRPRSFRLLFNYWREVGARNVVRKVVSRTKERLRNQKFVAVGTGQVLEAAGLGTPPAGSWVAFVAPAHPAGMERVVLHADLVRLVERPPAAAPTAPACGTTTFPGAVELAQVVGGWTSDAGTPAPRQAIEALLAGAPTGPTALDEARPSAPPPSVLRERTKAGAVPSGRPTAVIFGLGNYAKTAILPNLRGHLDVRCIHEVDPCQIGATADGTGVALDTSPLPRTDERYDAWFIAGFHHHHAGLAVHALRQGAAAVVEKPLVTTRAQLDLLAAALADGAGRLFGCFQRRYLPFNAWARQDLQSRPQDPISYHCIVYEVPLPARHWYRWPNSRSRVISNGCHWLDHFLFLNDFAAPVQRSVQASRDGTASVTVELENGAVFTMALTDQGSSRIGVQDHVELRLGVRTVTMRNASHYAAEGPTRFLRRARINKLDVYGAMYRQIAKAIAQGAPGDPVASVLVSSQLAIDLDEAYQAAMGGAG
ncbi:MAG: Gfo/Idh/MocA family oxidoreductase [Anaeromyxobacter sp.]|nr:Gfo/Idh/MocA family oxidoreductase [Anaeromyxobacter sp.]